MTPDRLIEKAYSAYDYPLLIKNILHTHVVQPSDNEIVYANLMRYNYRTLLERVCRLASVLAALGIEQGDTVAVMDWDSHRYLECFFAVPMMGAVLHTVNVRLSPDQILYTINHAEDDAILVNAEFLPILEQIKDRIKSSVRFVLINDGKEQQQSYADFSYEYEDLLQNASSSYIFPELDENTRATTFYTTGTTGPPKGVYYSHRQLVLHTLGLMAALCTPGVQGRFHKDDAYLPITPMFHVHAWGLPYAATLMGVKQVYPGRYTPEGILSLIQKEKVTFSHCVPTILHMLLNHPMAKEVDLSCWKVIIGGAACPKSLCKTAMNLGVDIFAAYGMSETCPFLTVAQLDTAMLHWDTDQQIELRCKTGRPLPLVDLRIVDEEMGDIPHDGATKGEIVVRAPWLTQGYLKDPQNSENLWSGGYLHTGDIATMDQLGYVKISDRSKDLIKTGGEWISSLLLEDIICQHPDVSEAAVIGIKDDKWGERPFVLVVLKSDAVGKISEEEIKAYLKSYIAKGTISKWAIPDRVSFVEGIEKTSVGKTDKKRLRQKYL